MGRRLGLLGLGMVVLDLLGVDRVFCHLGIAAWSGGARDIREIDSAEEILRERYARGEISKQEYDDKLNDLRRAA